MDAAGLQRVPLFSGLSVEEASGVLGTAKERDYPEGDRIVRQGQEGGRGFYLVVEGRVRVSTGSTTLAEFGPGEYFGEMALLLDDTPRTADVTATTAVRALVITQWDFRALIKTHPDIGVKLMAELARRLRDTDATVAD